MLLCVHHLAVGRGSSDAATLPPLHHHALQARCRGSAPLHMRHAIASAMPPTWWLPLRAHWGAPFRGWPCATPLPPGEQKRCRRVSKRKECAARRRLRVIAPHHSSIPCMFLRTPVQNKKVSTCSTHAPLPLFCQNLLHQLHRAQIQVNLVACTLATTAISGRRPTIIQRSDEPQ